MPQLKLLIDLCFSNIWAPHQQQGIVKLLADHYNFSPRLQAIICTSPPKSKPQDKTTGGVGRIRRNLYRKDDIEVATTGMSIDLPRYPENSSYNDMSHYTLAKQIINYQSYDAGPRFICVGANWMHELKPKAGDIALDQVSEGRQRRLYSWLVLCDDCKRFSFLQMQPALTINT